MTDTENKTQGANAQVQSLRDTIRWDREHLGSCIAAWRAEKMPVMRSYRRAVCGRVIWHIRIAQSNLETWGVQS